MIACGDQMLRKSRIVGLVVMMQAAGTSLQQVVHRVPMNTQSYSRQMLGLISQQRRGARQQGNVDLPDNVNAALTRRIPRPDLGPTCHETRSIAVHDEGEFSDRLTASVLRLVGEHCPARALK
jgi:hypothetical protein